MTHVYVIIGSMGDYSDRQEFCVTAVTSEDTAKWVVDELGKASRQLMIDKNRFFRERVEPLRKIMADEIPQYDKEKGTFHKDWWENWQKHRHFKEYTRLHEEAEKLFPSDEIYYSFSRADVLYAVTHEDVLKLAKVGP